MRKNYTLEYVKRYVSEYGKKYNVIDYGAIVDAIHNEHGSMILCNDLAFKTLYEDDYAGDWTNEDGDLIEYFQGYHVDYNAVEIITSFEDECIIYNNKYDMYFWMIDHFGTRWDHVSTGKKYNESGAV